MRTTLDIDDDLLAVAKELSRRERSSATDWLASHLQLGWASCPLTQNGCIRVLSLPAYRNSHRPADVARRLGDATAGSNHEFWPDAVSLLDAVSRGGRLVTLDRGIGAEAIAGAQAKHLLTLA